MGVTSVLPIELSLKYTLTPEDPKSDRLDQEVSADHRENQIAAELSSSHRQYLLERYGTILLDPIPSEDLSDPLNWPLWKVCKLLSSQKLINPGAN